MKIHIYIKEITRCLYYHILEISMVDKMQVRTVSEPSTPTQWGPTQTLHVRSLPPFPLARLQ